MKIIIRALSYFILCCSLLASCTKDNSGNLDDIRPGVPVTVQNATYYRPDPTVTTSKGGGGAIQIILTIPTGLGRSLKEITKVAASSSYVQIQSGSATGFYTTAPISASGTSVTFTTSLTEYFTKIPVSSANPAATSNVELANRFYFLITLDDGSQLVTQPVRILVVD